MIHPVSFISRGFILFVLAWKRGLYNGENSSDDETIAFAVDNIRLTEAYFKVDTVYSLWRVNDYCPVAYIWRMLWNDPDIRSLWTLPDANQFRRFEDHRIHPSIARETRHIDRMALIRVVFKNPLKINMIYDDSMYVRGNIYCWPRA